MRKMHQELINFVKIHLDIDLSEEELLKTYFKEINFKEKEHLLEGGQVCNKIYFLIDGLTRNYYLNEKGTEVTRKIGLPNDFIANFPSFENQIPSNETIECLIDAKLLYINYNDFYFLIESSSKFDKIFRLVLAQLQEYHVKQLEFLTCYTPLERLTQFKKEQPYLYQTLSNKVLASFLAISPETCSRLKNKI